MMEAMIVWWFRDAPEELRNLSNNGGDEDWLAEVPPNIDTLPTWMEVNTFDAGCEPQVVDHPSKVGWKVVIGSH